MSLQEIVILPEWRYSKYRALLYRLGKPFGVVTPDGVNALSDEDEKLLLDRLNSRATNAAILNAIKQTEDALLPLLEERRRQVDYYRHEADEYFYRWRSE